MVDVRRLLRLVPHYVAMLVLVLVAVAALRTVVPDVTPLADLVVALAVVFLYPFAVRRLGYAPDFWE